MKGNIRFKRTLALGLSALLLATGCGQSGAGKGASSGKGEITIASVNPMTGDSAQFGDIKVKAIEMAIEEFNEKDVLGGVKVKLAVGDDTGNPKEAPNVAQKFASDKNILALIGHWNSSCTLAARNIYEQAGLPVITDSVNKAITDGSTPHLFRISLTDTAQAESLADYAYNVAGKRKAAILYTANDFGTGLMNDFTAKFTALGGEVTASETYFEGQSKDFSPQITKIKEKNPDLLFVAGYYVETALIAQQAKASGLDIQILGTDGISSEELIKLGGDAVEGILFGAFFHPDVEFSGTKEFTEKFVAKYGKNPDTYAALAYDSAKIVLAAIEKYGAEVTREQITEYIKGAQDFPGVAGPITFKDNDVTRGVIVVTVQNGKFVPAEKQLGKE